ncbi:PRC-barrel domain-containing protein [Streptomyces globisporus]|uniref:PRC-barrel domain-containing protein n=1 Tax=Streptomyces TaxID=1883 RepID=UPI00190A5331|nr:MULTISPECIES: PRC-barrel domain-containing protein [unclassified Streptomyces]MBK3557978.1 PRC-barrel domain containing protein [Streptomyces sp. MBT56]MBK3604074.1 PRC-barrel domain containing protein [Streptomyces sp. MBT54]MBK3618950.1 PRC-barrel domain containing protein [Streptomyces sp. MBT98]MBK6046789.1 PRC-barrel domain containing protein [Streptomyces sp. MBT55]
MSDSLWGYQPSSGHTVGADLTGYSVEATDGSIGKVDKYSDEVGSAYLLVDIGVWIFGKDVLLPAGTVKRIDTADRKVYVDLTKEQVKDSPEFDRNHQTEDPAYHEQLSAYYTAYRIL